jgi:hypothetical protein
MTKEKEETRNDRFKRIAAKRTNDVLNKLRLLGNCSNRSGYDYSEEEVDKIFNTIHQATKTAKSKFSFGKRNKEFKL